MPEPPRYDLSMYEWEAWHRVVKALKACGAVTEADCNASQRTVETPGQKLFAAIREWGDLLAALRVSQKKEKT